MAYTHIMKSPKQLWFSLSPKVQYEIGSILRTFATTFLTSLAVQANSVHDLSRSALIGIVAAALRSASKAVFTAETKTKQ